MKNLFIALLACVFCFCNVSAQSNKKQFEKFLKKNVHLIEQYKRENGTTLIADAPGKYYLVIVKLGMMGKQVNYIGTISGYTVSGHMCVDINRIKNKRGTPNSNV